jgi:citrate lyase beta subunit
VSARASREGARTRGRPRRALIFTPATERRKIEKAASLGADGVIVDLEDSVALSRKEEGRAQGVAALAEVDFGKSERILRLNAEGSGLEEADLAAALAGARLPDAILLPKVERADAVRAVADALTRAERSRALAPGSVKLLAIIETARGVVRLAEIAAAHPRLEALVFGAEDLSGDIGAVRTRAGKEVEVARGLVVLHAAAERLQAIDTPFVHLEDEAGLANETREALEMGYTGKLVIHPRQLAPILAVFTPREDELRAALHLLAEHERHQREGLGVFALDGKMVDMPMVRAAERVIARARGAGLLPPEA